MEKQTKTTAQSGTVRDPGNADGQWVKKGKGTVSKAEALQAAAASKAAASKAAADAAELARMAVQAEAAFAGTAGETVNIEASAGGDRAVEKKCGTSTGGPSDGGTSSGGTSSGGTSSGGTSSGSPSDCSVTQGRLPGTCASLAFPYVPVQGGSPVRYSRMEALETGTLFPGLNLPFKAAIQAHTKLNNTALVELMALDFALQELGLYLNTHPQDQEVLQLYWSYVQLAKEGRERYQEAYGPLMQTDLTPEQGYAWLKDPWPWDLGGNR